jgi:hypothetical protein
MRPTGVVWLCALALAIGLAACGPRPRDEAESSLATLLPELPASDSAETHLTDGEVRQVLTALAGRERPAGAQALARVLQVGDQRFVAVLIEVLRGLEVGIPLGIDYPSAVSALQQLSGQQMGANWAEWVEWYGATELNPPPGFTGWKGSVLGFIDARFAEFLTDEAPSRIRVEEIVWGGVSVDGIPALNRAQMVAAAEADYLLPEEPVFGISLNGDSRAYPLRILDWHEMANDVVGGVPLSLAYCTLCGAAIAYQGLASDGGTYTFGSSGLLFRSNKLMYDHQTRSLWNQLTGEPVLGPLASTDLRLSLLPLVLTSWSDWRAQHPATRVLRLETGYQRYYLPGAAYGHYFSGESTMFPVWDRSQQLRPKDRIYALRVEGIPKAYPLELLVAEQVVNDRIGASNVVLVATRGRVTVEGVSLQAGPVVYDAGGEVRAYARGDRTFTPGPAPDMLMDAEGSLWQVTEEALRSAGGELAPRLSGHLAYWFGWFAFFPDTLLYSSPDPANLP